MRDIIDVHTHYVPKGWPDLSDVAGAEAPWLRVESEREAMMMTGSTEFRRIQSDAWDPEVRVADMDADGVAAQVVSPTPVFFNYARSGEQAARIATVFNDLALEIVESTGDRMIPFCQVPLQDTDLACAELDRCIANGHRGVEIGNHVGDRDLDDEGVVTFLQHCAEKDIPVFVHPWDMAGSPRLDRWMARWLVGMPAESHLSILAMILGGTFDRVDERLKIAFAHGGGSFAFWLGRMENAWHRRNDVIGTSEFRRRTTSAGSTSTPWSSTSAPCVCWSTPSAANASWSAATTRTRWANVRSVRWSARATSSTTPPAR